MPPKNDEKTSIPLFFHNMSHDLKLPCIIFALEFYLQWMLCGGMTILIITY